MNIIPSIFSQVACHNIYQITEHQGDLNVQDSSTKSELRKTAPPPKTSILNDKHKCPNWLKSFASLTFLISKQIQSYHNSTDESEQLRFYKFPQNVPFEVRHWVFGYNFHGGVIIHICLTVGYMAKQSSWNSKYCWSQDKLQSYSRGFRCPGGGLTDSSLSQAPNATDSTATLLWGAVCIRPWGCVPPGYRPGQK